MPPLSFNYRRRVHGIAFEFGQRLANLQRTANDEFCAENCVLICFCGHVDDDCAPVSAVRAMRINYCSFSIYLYICRVIFFFYIVCSTLVSKRFDMRAKFNGSEKKKDLNELTFTATEPEAGARELYQSADGLRTGFRRMILQ